MTDFNTTDCRVCLGAGRVPINEPAAYGYVPCDVCDGSGHEESASEIYESLRGEMPDTEYMRRVQKAQAIENEPLRRLTHGLWVEWLGGECPIAEYEKPELRFRSGGTTEMPANRVRWSHVGAWDDIIAYRVRLPERNWQ